MIDLRSDTITQPTAAMRERMAHAPVGDDVYGDDPTVRALEERTAALLGKEDAVYMPTGTMTNQVALRTHTEPGDAILLDLHAHIARAEGGAPGALSGLTVVPLMGTHGIFTADDVEGALYHPNRFSPSTISTPQKLLCLENTHNAGGGVVWPLEQVEAVTSVARRHGLCTHLDGARLWNACVASGVSEAAYATPFDSVSVCFSKGLGAPVGSALAGPAAFVARARRFKQQFGGGFRQAGLLAAGALYALEHHRDRLAEDHEKARRFAEGLTQLDGLSLDLARVQTNIVRFTVEPMDAVAFVAACHRKGVYMLPAGTHGVRAILHLDVSFEEVQQALCIIKDVVAQHAAV